MSAYSPQLVQKLNRGLLGTRRSYNDALLLLTVLLNGLSDGYAKKYIWHGTGRRLQFLHKCIEIVFDIFPPNRATVLSLDESLHVGITLHAFFVNVLGLFDNLAWVLIYERKLSEEIPPRYVGLYYDQTQKILAPEFREFLNSPNISSWYRKHFRLFRDSLSHRIPLYVPPLFDEKTGEELPNIAFSGSIRDGKLMHLHSQMIADMNTVYAIIDKFAQFEFGKVGAIKLQS